MNARKDLPSLSAANGAAASPGSSEGPAAQRAVPALHLELPITSGPVRGSAAAKGTKLYGDAKNRCNHTCLACKNPSNALLALHPGDPTFPCTHTFVGDDGEQRRGLKCAYSCKSSSKHSKCKANQRKKRKKGDEAEKDEEDPKKIQKNLTGARSKSGNATKMSQVAVAAGLKKPIGAQTHHSKDTATNLHSDSSDYCGASTNNIEDVGQGATKNKGGKVRPIEAAGIVDDGGISQLWKRQKKASSVTFVEQQYICCPFCSTKVLHDSLQPIPTHNRRVGQSRVMVCANCAALTYCREPHCRCTKEGADPTAMCRRHRHLKIVSEGAASTSNSVSSHWNEELHMCVACVEHRRELDRSSKARVSQRKASYSQDQLVARAMYNLATLSLEPAPTAARETSWHEVPARVFANLFQLACKWKKQNGNQFPRLDANEANLRNARKYACLDIYNLRGRTGTFETGAQQFLRLYKFLTLKSTIETLKKYYNSETANVDWQSLIRTEAGWY